MCNVFKIAVSNSPTLKYIISMSQCDCFTLLIFLVLFYHTHTHDSEGEPMTDCCLCYSICTLLEERESPSAQLFMCIYQRHGRQIINIHPRMFVCINH